MATALWWLCQQWWLSSNNQICQRNWCPDALYYRLVKNVLISARDFGTISAYSYSSISKRPKFLPISFIEINKIGNELGWIGAYDDTGKNIYHWQDDLSSLVYVNWQSGEPNSASEQCVGISTWPNSLGQWVDDPCSNAHAALCKKNKV